METEDYKSGTCELHFLSEILPCDAEKLIGKTIVRVDAREYFFKLTFTDGTSVSLEGACYGDCSLGVECDLYG